MEMNYFIFNNFINALQKGDGNLTKYEMLLDSAVSCNMEVIENYNLSETKIKGLYCNGVVALSNTLHTESERCCVLAEEIGHHYKSSGDILNQCIAENRKQEMIARTWAYNKLIGLVGIVDSYKAGCRNRSEMADHLNITEEFLGEALERYKNKYGTYTTIDNYIIYFEPALAVLEIQK